MWEQWFSYLLSLVNPAAASKQAVNAEELNRKANMQFTFCFSNVQIP